MRWLFTLALLLLAGCPGGTDETAKTGDTAPPDGASDDKAIVADKIPNVPEGAVWVLAEPALKVPLEALADQFRAKHPGGWYIEYVERGAIAERLTVNADVNVPAVVLTDKHSIDELASAGVVDTASSRSFAGDRLVVISRVDEDWRPRSFFDLHKMRFKALGCGDDSTLSGFYTTQAMTTSGSEPKLAPRLTRVASTPEVFEALTQDRVQLAIVLSSQAAQAPAVKTVLAIGEELYEDIRYQAAAVTGKTEAEGVMPLLVFLAENADVQQVFISYGLKDRTSAMKPAN